MGRSYIQVREYCQANVNCASHSPTALECIELNQIKHRENSLPYYSARLYLARYGPELACRCKVKLRDLVIGG